MLRKIYEVTDIKLTTLESFPPRLLITASGTVPTSGWSERGELIEFIYIIPPADGFYEFDFVGEPPSPALNVTQGLRPIIATFVMNLIPNDLKGVKVYASNNSKKEEYDNSSVLTLEISRVGNS